MKTKRKATRQDKRNAQFRAGLYAEPTRRHDSARMGSGVRVSDPVMDLISDVHKRIDACSRQLGIFGSLEGRIKNLEETIRWMDTTKAQGEVEPENKPITDAEMRTLLGTYPPRSLLGQALRELDLRRNNEW